MSKGSIENAGAPINQRTPMPAPKPKPPQPGTAALIRASRPKGR